MDLDRYSDRIRDDLLAAAALGDEKTQATAEALAGAVQNSARLALLSALTELADIVSTELGDRTVRVGLHDSEAVVEVHRTTTHDNPSFEDMTGDISRVTLRLVEQVKSRAEDAAAQSGQSLNSWMTNVVSGALRDQWQGGSSGGGYRGYGSAKRDNPKDDDAS